LLRVTVGLTLAAHGTQKLFGWFSGLGLEGTGQGLAALGFHPGRRHAFVAGLVELTGGLLLALGLATPLASTIFVSGSVERASVSVPSRYESRRPRKSATTPVGTSKRTSPAVKNASAAKPEYW
jgi:putative oxidoreductase